MVRQNDRCNSILTNILLFSSYQIDEPPAKIVVWSNYYFYLIGPNRLKSQSQTIWSLTISFRGMKQDSPWRHKKAPPDPNFTMFLTLFIIVNLYFVYLLNFEVIQIFPLKCLTFHVASTVSGHFVCLRWSKIKLNWVSNQEKKKLKECEICSSATSTTYWVRPKPAFSLSIA